MYSAYAPFGMQTHHTRNVDAHIFLFHKKRDLMGTVDKLLKKIIETSPQSSSKSIDTTRSTLHPLSIIRGVCS